MLRLRQITKVCLQIGADEFVEASRRLAGGGRGPGVQPAKKSGDRGEVVPDRGDLRSRFAWREIPRQHRVEKLLDGGSPAGGNVREVQRQQYSVLRDDRWPQPPGVIFETRGLVQRAARAQRSAGKDELGVEPMRRICGRCQGCCHGCSTRSRSASVGLAASACSISAGVNLARMSWRIAAQTGPYRCHQSDSDNCCLRIDNAWSNASNRGRCLVLIRQFPQWKQSRKLARQGFPVTGWCSWSMYSVQAASSVPCPVEPVAVSRTMPARSGPCSCR